MNELVAAGLQIMRDPTTCKAKGTLRRVDAEGNACLCAMGCIAQAAVSRGEAQWGPPSSASGTTYLAPADLDLTGMTSGQVLVDAESPVSYHQATDELFQVGMPIWKVTSMNDVQNMPLSEIADRIEKAYAAREAGRNA